MQVSKTSSSPTKVNITIAVGAEELEPIRRHVLRHFIRSVRVPGFRPGKAPLELVEKNVDRNAFLDEFIEHAVNDCYGKVVEKENLRPVSRPEVKMKKFVPFSELEFEAEVEVLGAISLPDYKKLKLPKPKASVSAKDVTEVLESLALRSADRKTVESEAKEGHELVIDFAGKDDKGQPVSGAEAKDYPLIIGSKAFIPGFEEQLKGLKAGENKKFDIVFPADYGVAAMRGKKISFEVTVKKVNELIKAKIDDKFAGKIGPFGSLSDLKADIKKQLLQERQQQADRDYESKLIKEITEQSKIDIPASLIDEQVMRMEEDERRNLVYRGETWGEHLKAEGITEEQHRQRQRPQAAERVKAGLVLSEIASREKLQVTPEELELRLQILKGQYQDPAMQAELDKPENRQDIASRLLTEKTINSLVSYSSK